MALGDAVSSFIFPNNFNEDSTDTSVGSTKNHSLPSPTDYSEDRWADDGGNLWIGFHADEES